MKRIIVLALFLSGCAGTVYDDDDESPVHRAAMSWVGAPIDDMVAVWGEPNNLRIDPTETNDGLFRWRDTRRPTENNAVGGSRSYTCIVEAYFGQDRAISRVETLTTNCDELYTDERLNLLTR